MKRYQFALYADHERGWYPVWQSLDMHGFFPGSGILFVTVTVSATSPVAGVLTTRLKG
jgi:hypothetical protein